MNSTKYADHLLNFVIQNNWKNIIVITKDFSFTIRLLSSMFLATTIIPLHLNRTTATLLNTYHRFGSHNVITLCDMKWKTELANLVRHVEIFGRKITWLFIHDQTNNDFEEFLKLIRTETLLGPNCDVFSLITSHVSIDAHLVKLVTQKKNLTHNVEVVAMHGLDVRHSMNRGLNRLPLHGYKLKISTIDSHAIVYPLKLLDHLAKYLGFSYTFVFQPTYGLLQNGTWTGIVGAVHRQEADVGLFIGLTSERAKAVDFSTLICMSRYVVVIRRATTDTQEWKLFLFADPFSMLVWISCAATCALIFGCMIFILKTYMFCGRQEMHKPDDFSMKIIIWNFVCLLLQTDTLHLTCLRPGRIVFIASALFVLLITKTYLSLLTAHLTMKSEPKQYNDLAEVLDEGKFGLTLIPRTCIVEDLMNAKSGVLRRAWNKIQSDPGASFVSTTNIGIEMLKTKDVVHLSAEPLAIPEIKKSPCMLEFLKQSYGGITVHFIFPKNSSVSEFINLKILSMRSSGVLKRLQEKYLPSYDPSVCKTKSSMAIPVQQAIGIFLILGLCLLLSLLYLFVERTCKK